MRLFAILVFFLAIGIDANACSCPERSLEQNFTAAQTVFLAQITSARHVAATSTVEVTVQVKEVFKGTGARGTRQLVTADAEAICGIAVVVPREYVFFIASDGIVSRCSGSFQLQKAARFEPRVNEVRQLAKLRALR